MQSMDPTHHSGIEPNQTQPMGVPNPCPSLDYMTDRLQAFCCRRFRSSSSSVLNEKLRTVRVRIAQFWYRPHGRTPKSQLWRIPSGESLRFWRMEM